MLVWLLTVLSSPSSPPPQLPPSCPNTCLGAPELANDGECDDGGPGSAFSVCAFGILCAVALTLALSLAPSLNPKSPNPHLSPHTTTLC